MLGTGQMYTQQTLGQPHLCCHTHYCFLWKGDASKKGLGRKVNSVLENEISTASKEDLDTGVKS